MNIDYFKSIQGSLGLNSKKEVLVSTEKRRIAREIVASSHYEPKAKRNDLYQPLILSPTKTPNISNIFTIPDDELYAGDIIQNNDERWLVSQVSTTNPFQIKGKAWLCNQLIRFQNHNPTIIERWGFLDTGTYTTDGTNILSLDYDAILYLPYDEDTKKLFVDKRLAIDKGYDSTGKEVVIVYRIVGVKPDLRSYGDGTHLLSLTLKSADYAIGRDSISEMICDFIAVDSGDEEQDEGGELLSCDISGRNTIYVGTSRTYTAIFYDENGEVSEAPISAVWDITPDVAGISFVQSGNSITIFTENKDSLIGEEILVSVSGIDGLYKPSTLKVVVI